MTGGLTTTTTTANTTFSTSQTLLGLVRDVTRISGSGFDGAFKKDCTDLSRRITLLSYLLEEIKDYNKKCELIEADGLPSSSSSSSSLSSDLSDLTLALQASKRLLLAATSFDPNISKNGASKKIAFQFQCVTWRLEKALGNLSYDHFEISEEVKEQVDLVRGQLKRATARHCQPLTSNDLSCGLSQPNDKDISPQPAGNTGCIDHEVEAKMHNVLNGDISKGFGPDQMIHKLEKMRCSSTSSEVCILNSINAKKSTEENKKNDSPVIPDDFLCPISLELMRDPVIVATGQTYERSYIQRWVDCGNKTCPKTRQKLENLTLTPNYVLRSLITQWCTENNVEQTTLLANRRIKRNDGSFRDVIGDIAAIRTLVGNLSRHSIEGRRAAVAEIRLLSKSSADNRILIAEAGAIPILVTLLTSEDGQTQENAVTSILNLSIYENNKGLIMLANAVPSIVQVLRAGSMESKENSAATLFSLSLADENKIIIGASGAIDALVELLKNGSSRGRKDAATALFNLCIYQGNKGRAVRAGIITVLLKMLKDSSCMVDEALTILSVLAGHQEAKGKIVKASIIPVLIDLMRSGLPRNKENAAAILLSLCKRDNGNLACISRLGAVVPLTELSKSGTERAKRKANSLLQQLCKIQKV